MSSKRNPISTLPGAKPLSAKLEEKLYSEMARSAVPEVVNAVRKRQLRAAEARLTPSRKPDKKS